jgi:hypothetical protein
VSHAFHDEGRPGDVGRAAREEYKRGRVAGVERQRAPYEPTLEEVEMGEAFRVSSSLSNP